MNTESSLSAREQRVNEAIAAYLEAADAGRALDRQTFIAGHPEIATELEAFARTLRQGMDAQGMGA